MKLNSKNLANVELGIPVIAEGIYHARIAKVEIKENSKKDGNNLAVQYKILDNPVMKHSDGSPIENKGNIVCTRHYSLKPTDSYDPDTAMKELAVAINNPPEKDLESEDLLNKIVLVKLEHKPEEKDEKTGKTYPAGNDIRRTTPVPADDPFQAPPFA